MTREETLIAYTDGELPQAERARFEAEMASDPKLKAEVARHRALVAQVNGAYAPVLDETVPARLRTVASAANDPGRAGVRRLAPWAAVAASLLVGVMVGRLALPDSSPLATKDGVLVARGQLAIALSSQLSAQPGVVKVGLTVKAADGRYCRTFADGADRLAGLACRRDGRWAARMVTAWSPANNALGRPAYRTAGSETPPEVLAAVDGLAGQPLDAPAERAARDAGWK